MFAAIVITVVWIAAVALLVAGAVKLFRNTPKRKFSIIGFACMAVCAIVAFFVASQGNGQIVVNAIAYIQIVVAVVGIAVPAFLDGKLKLPQSQPQHR